MARRRPSWSIPNPIRPDFGRTQFRSILVRYGNSLAVIAAAITLRLWFDPVMGHEGFAIFLIGILLAAWVGGLGPCLIGQTLILFADIAWFSPIATSPQPTMTQVVVSLAAFYSVGAVVAVLSEAWQGALHRLKSQRDEALSQREQVLATLSCIADGVLVADMDGRLSLMNPVAESMTGWTLAEAEGKDVGEIFSVIDEHSREVVEHPVHGALRTGEVLQATMRLLLTNRTDGRLPLSYSAAPVSNAAGKITGAVLIFRDETERRRAVQALRNADRQKDEFLATLAHELRNPLAPICMGLELLKSRSDDPAAAADIRGMMDRQARQMVRLIDDLLDISRITRGKLELRRTQLQLADIVRNAVEATLPLIEGAGHQLSIRLPERPVLLYADPNRLTQVMSNLLNNAARYTPRGGRIELEAEQFEGEVVVTVSDNGRGIPADEREGIFEMFTQARGAKENGHKGLGVGLTLVKRLVELHGGTVSVESDGQDMGSRFRVRLPIASPLLDATEQSATAEPSLPAAMRHRVLVVDDNEDALNALSLLVHLFGNEVYQARDGVEAIEAAERFRPDILLMDLGMPRLNGFDAARRIREQAWSEQLVLIAMTGWGQDEDRRRTRDAGFNHHLVKPADPEKLRELLGSVVPRRVADPPDLRPDNPRQLPPSN